MFAKETSPSARENARIGLETLEDRRVMAISSLAGSVVRMPADNAGGTPATAVAFSRRNVARRDHHTCQYCGVQPGSDQITIDHVLPRSRGGASSWTNCVAACAACNAGKADRTPEQAGMRLRKTPVRPLWRPWFAAREAQVESWSRFLGHEPELALA